MLPPQRSAGHPGHPRHRRLVIVRRSRDEQTRAAVRSEQWEATMIGLRAADILRQRFADFYAAHVAGLTSRPTHFIGII
ncbi:hypothetical protein [Chloroflexus sp.]|uniref:hypothetical protein n=1 Tax=Chloroflexus sp. TaxID=1904827 RepID=UPI002ACD7A54|nr:hypothetical protein [Chloroflexus sp.]